MVDVADRPPPNPYQPGEYWTAANADYPSSPWSPPSAANQRHSIEDQPFASDGLAASAASAAETISHQEPTYSFADSTLSWNDLTRNNWYDPVKSGLAFVGLLAVAIRLVKAVR
jgi:hypothetical protein